MSSGDDLQAHKEAGLTHAPSIRSAAFVLIGVRNPRHDSKILRKEQAPRATKRRLNEAAVFDNGEKAKASICVIGDMEA